MRLLSLVTGVLLGRSRPQQTASAAQSRPARDAWLTLPDVIACPMCDVLYTGETDLEGEPGEREDQELEAMNRLAAECPDHPDYFVVGI